MAKHFLRSKRSRAQERYPFNASIWQHIEVESALIGLFGSKCAYCESPLGADNPPVVDHFRPRAEALGLDGRSSPDHYWWLAYDWENLYLACRICHLNKGVKFPVAVARVPADSRGSDLRAERPLLLDPCNDPPERYLSFTDEGRVESVLAPSSPEGPGKAYDRSAITIDILGLNREELVQRRFKLARELEQSWQAVLSPKRLPVDRREVLRQMASRCDPRIPYAGMVRQFLRHQLTSLSADTPPEFEDVLEALRAELALPPRVTRENWEIVWPATHPVRSALPTLSPGFIRWVQISNFRGIRKARLEFEFAVPNEAGWRVLLGENGAGKSSVLQAVALALLSSEERRGLGIDLAKLLHCRAQRGFVEVGITTADTPLRLEFDRNTMQSAGDEGLPTLIRGYGAIRLLPRVGPGGEPASHRQLRKVKNLFDPVASLGNPTSWLAALPRQDFDRAARTLKDLLRLETHKPLRRKRERIEVQTESGDFLSLDQLSDGYQSVLAIAADIMAGAPAGLNDFQNLEGIVLLDEIGAHLHPRWRMEIVGSLRRAFPRLQFLATTHEPLCLRGLKNREVAVMRRDARRVWIDGDLPSPEGLRVDQLLTSPLFGLDSTIEPEIDRKFQKYYALLARHDEDLSPDDLSQRAALRDELSIYGVLGYTRRDQMVYEIIDQYLAQELQIKDPRKRQQLRQETKQSVADLWKRLILRGEPRR